jgi:hypothetical protein
MLRRRPLLLACAAVICAATLGRAEDAVSRARAVPVTVTWAGLPLRHVAARLAEIGGIAVVVDRRLDPDTTITLDVAAEPLDDVLARVADAARAELAFYAGHVRLVPRGGAAALTAAERSRASELRAAAASLRAIAGNTAAWSWADGAVPHDLLATAAAEADIVLDGLDALPHDHVPAARLPALTLADRLDLLLAHFDRRVAWRPRPGPRHEPVALAVIPLPTASMSPPAAPERKAVRRPATAAPPTPGPATYTLTVAAPLDELLTTLARRFGLALDLDRTALARAGVAPAEIVRLELKDVSREQLLDAVCTPRGLTWRIERDTLAISAAPR